MATKTAIGGKNNNGPRWGMTIDFERCVACRSCKIACKVENGTLAGTSRMRLLEKEQGTCPSARKVFLLLRCSHRSDPACVPLCLTGASYKREKDNPGDLHATVGKRETTTNLPQGSTVKDLLTSLSDNYGKYSPLGFSTGWEISSTMSLFFSTEKTSKGLRVSRRLRERARWN